jgi:hypothetical protein
MGGSTEGPKTQPRSALRVLIAGLTSALSIRYTTYGVLHSPFRADCGFPHHHVAR